MYSPERLQRVQFYDNESKKNLTFLSNNFILPSSTIAQLINVVGRLSSFKMDQTASAYKSFYRSSEKAIKTQIWIVFSAYVHLAIVKKHLNLNMALCALLKILSVTVFEKFSIYQLLTEFDFTTHRAEYAKQLKLFEL